MIWGENPLFSETSIWGIYETGSNETIWKDGICVFFFLVWYYTVFLFKALLQHTPQNQSLLNFQAPDLETYTLPETNIAPENRPSQKETRIPTIHFQLELLVSGSTSNPTNNIQPTSTNQPTELSIRFGNPPMSFTAGPSSSVLVCTSIRSTWRSASLAMSDWLVALNKGGTVDGRNPANHLGCSPNLVNNGINYLSTGAGFLPWTVGIIEA